MCSPYLHAVRTHIPAEDGLPDKFQFFLIVGLTHRIGGVKDENYV